jgi:hypothetical protein
MLLFCLFAFVYFAMDSKVALWKDSLLKSIQFFLHESSEDRVDKKIRICLSETVNCELVLNDTDCQNEEDINHLECRPTCQLFSRDCLSLKLMEQQIRNCTEVLGRHNNPSCPKEGIISFYFMKKDVYLTNSTHYIPIQLKNDLMEAFD